MTRPVQSSGRDVNDESRLRNNTSGGFHKTLSNDEEKMAQVFNPCRHDRVGDKPNAGLIVGG